MKEKKTKNIVPDFVFEYLSTIIFFDMYIQKMKLITLNSTYHINGVSRG